MERRCTFAMASCTHANPPHSYTRRSYVTDAFVAVPYDLYRASGTVAHAPHVLNPALARARRWDESCTAHRRSPCAPTRHVRSRHIVVSDWHGPLPTGHRLVGVSLGTGGSPEDRDTAPSTRARGGSDLLRASW